MNQILRKSVQSRPRFIVFSIVVVGIPLSTALIFEFGQDTGIGFWLFLTTVAICSSIAWGFLMWQFFVIPTRAAIRTEIERAKKSLPQ